MFGRTGGSGLSGAGAPARRRQHICSRVHATGTHASRAVGVAGSCVSNIISTGVAETLSCLSRTRGPRVAKMAWVRGRALDVDGTGVWGGVRGGRGSGSPIRNTGVREGDSVILEVQKEEGSTGGGKQLGRREVIRKAVI